MSIKKLTANVEVVQTLSTYPNQEDELSPEELKAKFDEGAKVIKDFINEQIVPAINEIQEKAPSGGSDNAVLFTPQELTDEQKAQARKNIDAALDAPDYYHTEREELGVGHDAINTDYVYGLYDALMAQYPDYVEKKSLTASDGSVVLYEFVITCNTEGHYTSRDKSNPARRPKYLIQSAIHGSERNTAFSVYRFVRDVLSGHNVPSAFRDGAVLHVIPVVNPTGFDAFKYEKANGVNINHNFDWNWQEGKAKEQALIDKGGKPWIYGDNVADQPETQAIAKWMHENSDALAFIDCHNSGILNENVMIMGSPNNDDADRVVRAAMRGVDRVIPYWRDVIGYPDVEAPVSRNDDGTYNTKVKPVIFSYSVFDDIDGGAFSYAQHVVGIPGFGLEMLCFRGNFSEWWDYDKDAGKPSYQPEVIAMGAEALGNILIELFSESSEVKDMAGVSNKLDTLMESVNKSLSFRVESDTLKITDISKYYDSATSRYNLGIPCSKGAKTIAVYPDEATLKAIYNSQTTQCFGSFVGNFFAPDAGIEGLSPEVQSGKYFMRGCSYMTVLKPHPDPKFEGYWVLSCADAYNNANNAPDSDEYGVIIPKLPALSAGTYKWVAYYWDDVWTGGSY